MKLFNQAKKFGSAVVLTAAASSSAYAIDDAAVTAAFDAGEVSVGVAVAGLIAMIAVVVGVGMVIKMLNRG